MATSYGTIIGHPEYAKLSQDQKRDIAQQFWKDDPLAADAVVLTQDTPQDLSSIQQKAFDDRKKISALRIASREPEAAQYTEQINAGIKEQEDNLSRLSSIYTPEAQNDINALIEPARNTGWYGSLPFENQLGRIGVGYSPEEYQEIYNNQRDATAQKYGVTTEQLDDVVRHQMDAQEKPVSRDALGRVHIKNDVFIQGLDSVKKGVEDSDLPASVKARELEGIDERYQGFQEAVVANTLQNHKDYAKEIGLDASKYPTEKPDVENDEWFKNNPNTTGMAWGGGLNGSKPDSPRVVILNPYSQLNDQQKQGVILNEQLRHFMDEKKPEIKFSLTNEQKKSFEGTEYGKPENENYLKQTIIARILTGDESAGNFTEEQEVEANRIWKQFSSKEEDFKKIVESLNTGKFENEFSSAVQATRQGGAAVVRGLGNVAEAISPEFVGESGLKKTADEIDQRKKIFESQLALSNEFNNGKLNIFGLTPGAIGQGIGSVVESAVIARATGGLIPRVGGAGALSGYLNSIRGVAPTAAIIGTRTGLQTYDDAIKQGLSEEDAIRAGFASGVIEAGTTLAFSAAGAGGVEDIAAGMKKTIGPSIKSAFGAAAKDVAKSTLGEVSEESIINALDQALVQTTVRPGMTTDQFLQSVKDTAIATLVAAGPITAASGVSTYQQTNEQLRQRANEIAQENLPPVENEGGNVPKGSTPSLAEERATLTQQLGTLEGDERLAVQERIAEIDAEIASPSENINSEAQPVLNLESEEQTLLNEEPEIVTEETQATDTQQPVEQLPEPVTEESVVVNDAGGTEVQETVNEQETIPTETSQGAEAKQVQLGTLGRDSEEEINEPSPNPPEATGSGVEESATIPQGTSESTAETPTAPPEPASSTTEEPIGPRKSINTAIRKKYGLSDPTVRVPQTTREAVEAADAELAQNPNAGRELVTSLQETGRIANAKETALLSHEFTKAVNELERAEKRLQDTSGDDYAKRTRISDYEAALSNFNNLSNLISTNASEASFRLNAQKILRRKDYSYAGMLDRAYAAKNRGASSPTPLTKEETSIIKQQSERLAQLEEDLAVAEQEAYARGRQDAENERLAQAKKKLPKSKKTNDEKVADLTRKAKEARQRLNERLKRRVTEDEGRRFSGGITDEDIVDVAIIATSYIRAGAIALADFTTRLVKEFGESARPFAERIFAEANAILNGVVKTPEQLVAEMDPTKPINRQSVNLMVKSYLEENIKLSAQDVVKKLQSDLSEKWPDITPQQASDAWTGYGQESARPQTRSEVQRAAIDLRRAALLQRQIEDLKAGKYNKKTRTLSQVNEEISRLTTERNELLKAAKVPVPRDPVAAAKTNVRNQIEKLRQAVANNELIPERTTQSDAELDALRAELKSARDLYNEAFPEQGTQLTPNQEEDRVVKALDKQIEVLEKQEFEAVKKQDFSWFSPEISEKRKRLNDLREARNEIRWQENSAKTTQKAIDALEDILATGNLPETSKRKPKYTPDQRLKALLDEKNQLQKRVAELRKQRGLEDAQYKAAEKSLREYERRIRDRDFEQKPRTAAVSERVKQIRAQRDAAQKQLAQMRRENESQATREARQIRALERSREDYEQRLRDGDFAKTKKEPLDTEAVRKARYERDKAKAEFDKRVAALELANYNKWQTFLRRAGATASLLKMVKLAGDLGNFFRNVGPYTIKLAVNPLTWGKLIRLYGTGTRSFLSAQNEYDVYNAYNNHPLIQQYGGADKLGLKLVNPFDESSASQEAGLTLDFVERLAESQLARNLGVGKLAQLSLAIERANRTWATASRAEMFMQFANLESNRQMSTKEAKDLAQAINIITGYGGLSQDTKTGQAFEKAVPFLNNTITLSARWAAAKIQYGLGVPIWNTPGYANKARMIRDVYAINFAGRVLLGAAAKAIFITLKGGDFPDDPEEWKKEFLTNWNPWDSENGGGLKFDGTKISFDSGNDAFLSLIAKSIPFYKDGTWERREVKGGKWVKVEPRNLGNKWTSYFANRMNPVTSSLYRSFIKGQNYDGKPLNLHTTEGAWNLTKEWFQPIIASDIDKIYKNHGMEGVLIFLSAFHGANVRFKPGPKAKEGDRFNLR